MVEYEFRGNVPNDTIIDYYAETQPDCFITTSSSEGLPVSVMEAMGCGIPIIGTNVGGMSELINDNGFLLVDNPTIQQVAAAIVKLMNADEITIYNMRKASRSIWEDKFDSEKNARLFLKYINCIGNTKKIVLITEGYPYGGERSFIEPELRELIRHYDVDIICPTSDEQVRDNAKLAEEYINRIKCNQQGETHEIKVIKAHAAWNLWKNMTSFMTYFFDDSILEERKSIWESKNRRVLRYWESMKYYSAAIDFYRETLKDALSGTKPSDMIVYTYWHTYRTLAACLHKNRYDGLKIITREHGFDLYDERRKRSFRQPFREVMDCKLDGIIFACNKGREYYYNRNHVKSDDRKYKVYYLGSAASQKSLRLRNESVFRIVSCSDLIPLKRIELIIEGLRVASNKMPDKSIKWVHFGDGPMMAEIKDYARKRL